MRRDRVAVEAQARERVGSIDAHCASNQLFIFTELSLHGERNSVELVLPVTKTMPTVIYQPNLSICLFNSRSRMLPSKIVVNRRELATFGEVLEIFTETCVNYGNRPRDMRPKRV